MSMEEFFCSYLTVEFAQSHFLAGFLRLLSALSSFLIFVCCRITIFLGRNSPDLVSLKRYFRNTNAMRKGLLICGFLLGMISAIGQTLGGSNVFSFLRLSQTPQLTALGGVNVTNQSSDIGLGFNNPALLDESMHTQANLVFNSMYAGIKNYHFNLGFHHEKLKTDFAIGVNYFHYGTIPETDPSGNLLGEMRPVDYVVQLSASRAYLTRWRYGANFKFIYSGYGQYRSSGIAMDLGILYRDTASKIQASVLVKNMGVQLKSYVGAAKDDLPFDLQIGISKRLLSAPLQFSLTLHRLNQFDIQYADTLYNNENNFDLNLKQGTFSFDNIFRHIVLATQVYITDKVEITAAYNHLRRRELNVGSSGNGLNGFSMGVGVLLRKLQLRYARAYYQNNVSYHQVGLNLKLNDVFGLGKFGEKIGW